VTLFSQSTSSDIDTFNIDLPQRCDVASRIARTDAQTY
jgi:hypothetical protein